MPNGGENAGEMGADVRGRVLEIVRRHWGFENLRPSQEQAIGLVLAGRDSLLVLPTGGGKSLCYQAPALLKPGPTVVISPLIALMKDQVDGLKACGVEAVQLNSSLSAPEASANEQAVREGRARLVFVSPERVALRGFRGLVRSAGVATFAIDEAHCISHWGHDFRPEYRKLRELRDEFPEASFHAFTATATAQVRKDIVEQLGLRDPAVLVGNFDRPNLTYRVVPRGDIQGQITEVVDRHAGEAGIVYCMRRRDVDEFAAYLKQIGRRAVPYHAGLTADARRAAQDEFCEERCDIVVATVAFGMGIDRSNIRYVLHTAMPRSIEHYQQETGRAGRDGLEAECVLLYSAGDAHAWKRLVQKSVDEASEAVDPQYRANAFRHIDEMERYCRGVTCRHRALVAYFGQTYEPAHCGACDLCLGDAEPVADAQTIARKILSCVYRVDERFGAGHVAAVLCGSNLASIRERGHDRLSTYGLLKEFSQPQVRDFIGQLVGQGVLDQGADEYRVLRLNAASWDVMNERRTAQLRASPATRQRTKKKKEKQPGAKPGRGVVDAQSWQGVDRELFEDLRNLRRELAEARGVPPYIIFGDATLRDLARVRPSTIDRMRTLYGFGEVKLREFGQLLLERLDAYCGRRNLSRDT